MGYGQYSIWDPRFESLEPYSNGFSLDCHVGFGFKIWYFFGFESNLDSNSCRDSDLNSNGKVQSIWIWIQMRFVHLWSFRIKIQTHNPVYNMLNSFITEDET